MVKVSNIATFLEVDFYGKDFTVCDATSLDNIKDNTLSFSKNKVLEGIDTHTLILVPLDFEYRADSVYSVIKVKNPRLTFAKVVNNFFITKKKNKIDKTAIIGSNCKIERTVSIGAFCKIGDNVIIGKNTIIKNSVIIEDNTFIGNSCYIKSGAILGEDGFGFDFEEDSTPVRIPHIGNVTIGDNVEIGSNTVIARGTLDNTIINDNVKIDDHVFIAHNCLVGKNTVIIAFAEISGSVIVGKNCWIGPNCSIIQKVKIGDNVMVGIGAVVTKNIDSNKKVMGLDALGLKNLLKLKKRISYGK